LTTIDKYRSFCAAAPPDLPVFLHDWYLDAVCSGGSWEAAIIEKAGKVVAVWPFFIKRKMGRPYVVMPSLCRFMGPYILPEFRSARLEPGLLETLLEQMPRLAAFEQDFNYSAQNWLPFYWRGFRQSTRYSYVLDLEDLGTVWQNLASDYRNRKIPGARQVVEVRTGDDLQTFMDIHNRSYARQGMPPPVPAAFLENLDTTLARKQARAILFATDLSNGAVHSVAYLIRDQQAAYLLMAGDDPALRQSGAGILTTWEAIRYTKEVWQLGQFDFLGSMIQPIERVRRQFGAVRQPYFRVYKDWDWRWKLRRLLHK
jgi:hypothetical protein